MKKILSTLLLAMTLVPCALSQDEVTYRTEAAAHAATGTFAPY